MAPLAHLLTAALIASPLVMGAAIPPKPDPVDGVVGGEDTSPFQYPWLAMLTTKSGRQFCDGTMVAPNIVVTAGHCTVGQSASNVRVQARRWDKSKSVSQERGVDFDVVKLVNHPDYRTVSGSPLNDIAVWVLKLNRNYGNEPVETIEFARDVLPQSGNVKIAGWGATSEGGSSADILQEATVPIIDNASCQRSYSSGQIPSSVICAGYKNGGVDTCQGDSGGPLFVNGPNGPVLEGIVSWGDGCARPGKPGVYTRVSSFAPWIQTQIDTYGQ